MKATFFTEGKSPNVLSNFTEYKNLYMSSIIHYSRGKLDEYGTLPGILPQFQDGDVLLLIFDDDTFYSVISVVNLSHSKFDTLDFQCRCDCYFDDDDGSDTANCTEGESIRKE
jgi:hypothetical protein